MSDPAEVEVDARGTRCPVPVVEAARAARDAEPGTVLVVRATDPATAHDLPAWCRMRGHELVSLERLPDELVARVRLAPPRRV